MGLTPGRFSSQHPVMAALFSINTDIRYEGVRKLSEGGMGVVYEAEQHGVRGFVKRVAIKVIRSYYADQKSFIENFIGEARLVADLVHTNIVQTYQLGESRGTYFMAMEFVSGVNLQELDQQLKNCNKVLPVELAVFIASRVARGLAYAHGKTDRHGQTLGIVHRDVSLKNILIAFEGDVKLTDFGVAKARGFLRDDEGRKIAGKADFMSPEQADFRVTDKRSDLFSMGVVLAHLLLGYNLFRADTPEESRRRILTLPIPNFTSLNPLIDERLNQILHRALERDIDRRYPTADEMLYDLEYSIYHQGYGPTNETLGKYIRDLFGKTIPPHAGTLPATIKILAKTIVVPKPEKNPLPSTS